MSTGGFIFKALELRPWQGRYSRITGNTTTFKIRHTDKGWWPVVEWDIAEGRVLCTAIKGPEIEKLTGAVSKAGWKILLSRGLDMFNPPETNCGFEEMDQSLRSCQELHEREKTCYKRLGHIGIRVQPI